MTIDRDPGTIEFKLFQTINEVGPELLNRTTGFGLDALYKASNPNDPVRLAAVTAANVDVARSLKGLPRIFLPHLENQYERLLADLGGTVRYQQGDVFDRLASVMSEVGDVAGVLRASTHINSPDGRNFSNSEKNQALSEVDEAIEELMKMRKDIERL
ncbi:phage regulatory CII family protein [Terasakiella sp.]|uniref:phage regulatory CII family protein n=1 Tax=Terasakiella sp. TaxID=2034861 RepID=UPI003AA80FFE